MPSFNANMNTRCMAAQVGNDGRLTTSTRTCSDQLPFFCELQRSTDGGNIQNPASNGAAGVPVSVIVVGVMIVLVTMVLSVTVFLLRKRLKRHIYIGRKNNDVTESDTSSTFSRRTLVGQDYAEAEDIRRSRFLSTRSYDTTEQELATDNYNHLVHEHSQSNQPVHTGIDEPTYNEMDFNKLKLTVNDDAGFYSRAVEENSYDLLHRNKTSGNSPTGFEQYDHIASNRDPDKL
ncbi:hypothetical protein FSP39_021071 [Pinctada imbricata]|uniref:Uncharacterized protein n=1 Tax=Pinctada imbricata TaxID=66713 RepID=A0AA89BQG6_PINIB|nr:hypothetical protein FSP39_021071 [Pinctada imbricata]